ncbi:hypothetical protein B484DRAFT_93360 [Ochromonadaceae sp. CCMP2298]|nr:hypothetical protein B484DRAFT_93360 [Ochromonadaceae sp. CCMP2298]
MPIFAPTSQNRRSADAETREDWSEEGDLFVAKARPAVLKEKRACQGSTHSSRPPAPRGLKSSIAPARCSAC